MRSVGDDAARDDAATVPQQQQQHSPSRHDVTSDAQAAAGDVRRPASGYSSQVRPPSTTPPPSSSPRPLPHSDKKTVGDRKQRHSTHATRHTTATSVAPQGAQTTTTTTTAAVTRGGGSGHAVARTHDAVFTTGVHYNALQMTLAEEYALLRHRCRAAASYRGPLYVAEDVAVACAGCGGMVDPVTRVPAGKLYFHACCIRCVLCGRRSVTDAYVQVGLDALCSHCAARGLQRRVADEEMTRRGYVIGAVPRRRAYALWAADERARRTRAAPFRVNLPTLPGATAPSLTLPGRLHTFRNTPRRTFALLQRQQYYTQNDHNVLVCAALQHRDGGGAADTCVASILPRLQ